MGPTLQEAMRALAQHGTGNASTARSRLENRIKILLVELDRLSLRSRLFQNFALNPGAVIKMATTSADPLDCLYPRLLSSCSDQSIDLLHHRPKTWLENHNTDIAAIIAGFSDVVPLLRGLRSVEAIQKCLFPVKFIVYLPQFNGSHPA